MAQMTFSTPEPNACAVAAFAEQGQVCLRLSDGREVRCTVTAPVFHDPENLRRDG